MKDAHKACQTCKIPSMNIALMANRCVDGVGSSVCEDLCSTYSEIELPKPLNTQQDAWQMLKDAYRIKKPSTLQKRLMTFYETKSQNGDKKGLGKGREHKWDRNDINAKLRVLGRSEGFKVSWLLA